MEEEALAETDVDADCKMNQAEGDQEQGSEAKLRIDLRLRRCPWLSHAYVAQPLPLVVSSVMLRQRLQR